MALQGALDKSESSNSASSTPRGGRFPIACPISGRTAVLMSPKAVDTAQFCSAEDDLLDEQTTAPSSPTRRAADRGSTHLGAILEDECDGESDEGDNNSNRLWGSGRNSMADECVGSEGSSFLKPRAVSPDAQMRREYVGSQKSMSQVGSAMGIEVRMESASRCGGQPLSPFPLRLQVFTADSTAARVYRPSASAHKLY
jgi:hypothetical protein